MFTALAFGANGVCKEKLKRDNEINEKNETNEICLTLSFISFFSFISLALFIFTPGFASILAPRLSAR
jgi:hypothetical protein